jgi:hypothetical protein
MNKRFRIVGLALLAAAAFGSDVAAEEKFHKLSGAQIRANLAGMEVSDNVHWRDLYERNGSVVSTSMGRKRTGKWRVEKDQLCVEFEQEMPNCYEVLVSGKKARLQREGTPPLEVVIEPPSGRM